MTYLSPAETALWSQRALASAALGLSVPTKAIASPSPLLLSSSWLPCRHPFDCKPKKITSLLFWNYNKSKLEIGFTFKLQRRYRMGWGLSLKPLLFTKFNLYNGLIRFSDYNHNYRYRRNNQKGKILRGVRRERIGKSSSSLWKFEKSWTQCWVDVIIFRFNCNSWPSNNI